MAGGHPVLNYFKMKVLLNEASNDHSIDDILI